MTMKLELKVVDFTSRLPGPLAGALLADLGARVIKVEFHDAPDPFAARSSTERDEIFNFWRNNFNQKKETVLLDKEDDKILGQLFKDCDIVLCPPSKRFNRLKKSYPRPLFVEARGGSGTQKYLHDLNALFLTRSFKLHLSGQSEPEPPYLPFAGIVFAQQIALEALAGHIAKQSNPKTPNKTIYLDQAATNVLDKLWSKELDESGETKFLHNGRFPCYNIYRSLDGFFIGLAAVEEKFWLKFIQLFNLPLSLEDRYDESGKTGQSLKEMFLSYKASEIIKRIGDNDICLNVFARNEKEKL
ncbi:MAG: CoA transferase [Bacteriovoracaceae bacterium]